MKNVKIKILVASLLAAGALAATGCNTVHGAGTDLQKGSDATSKAIDKAVK